MWEIPENQFVQKLIERTIKIIEEYEETQPIWNNEAYEYTLLINCLLTLSIFVFEEVKKGSDKSFFTKKMEDILPTDKEEWFKNIWEENVGSFLKDFRDAVAHKNIVPLNKSWLMSWIKVYYKDPSWKEKRNASEFRYEELKILSFHIAETYLSSL